MGAYTLQELRQQLQLFTTYSPLDQSQAHIGYDGLDSLISGLFELHPPPQATQTLSADMVHYEPTPVRAILDLVDHVNFIPTDLFYDLGSGLGYVAMLVNLLSGIKTTGIELEPVFCTYAQSCARTLGLTAVEFINADARDADYTEGTVFYLFTPFKGALLQAVLAKLENEARTRRIKICTYGVCNPSRGVVPGCAVWMPMPTTNSSWRSLREIAQAAFIRRYLLIRRQISQKGLSNHASTRSGCRYNRRWFLDRSGDCPVIRQRRGNHRRGRSN